MDLGDLPAYILRRMEYKDIHYLLIYSRLKRELFQHQACTMLNIHVEEGLDGG